MKRRTSTALQKFARSRKLKLSWRVENREDIDPALRGSYRVLRVGTVCPIMVSDPRHDLSLGLLGDFGGSAEEERRFLRRAEDEDLLVVFVPRHLEQLLSEREMQLTDDYWSRLLDINGLKLFQVVDVGRRYLLCPAESSDPSMVELMAFVGDGAPKSHSCDETA